MNSVKDSGVKPPQAKAVTGHRTAKEVRLYKTLHEVNRVFTSRAVKMAYESVYAERLDG
jgi:hypothetical protein